jgi:hypothetical protein
VKHLFKLEKSSPYQFVMVRSNDVSSCVTQAGNSGKRDSRDRSRNRNETRLHDAAGFESYLCPLILSQEFFSRYATLSECRPQGARLER